MEFPKIQGIGVAVPTYAIEQREIKKFISALFHSHIDNLDRLLPIFENSRIHTRYFSQPLDWYGSTHSFSDANKIFEKVALELTEKASLEAMAKAKVKPEDIGMVIYVSSTGIVTPTLDAALIQRLGLSSHAKRLPVWGLGCGGGVSGLARAADLSYRMPEKSVLLVTVELCSLTFQQNDYSKSNLVGTSIFSDGAAAVLLSLQGEGPALLGNYSTLIPNSADVMGWDLVDTGLKVRFSRDIPSIVRRYLPSLLSSACDTWGIEPQNIKNYIVHPGGVKVLNAYSESLSIDKNKLAEAYEILASYGNMSSASVLFVMEKFMEKTGPSNAYGVMLALGPGFSAEQVMFRW